MGLDEAVARRRVGGPLLAAWVVGFAVLYFLAAKLGIATSLPPQGIVTIWPPNAIILVVLLAVERRHWWAFFAATVVTAIGVAANVIGHFYSLTMARVAGRRRDGIISRVSQAHRAPATARPADRRPRPRSSSTDLPSAGHRW